MRENSEEQDHTGLYKHAKTKGKPLKYCFKVKSFRKIILVPM